MLSYITIFCFDYGHFVFNLYLHQKFIMQVHKGTFNMVCELM